METFDRDIVDCMVAELEEEEEENDLEGKKREHNERSVPKSRIYRGGSINALNNVNHSRRQGLATSSEPNLHAAASRSSKQTSSHLNRTKSNVQGTPNHGSGKMETLKVEEDDSDDDDDEDEDDLVANVFEGAEVEDTGSGSESESRSAVSSSKHQSEDDLGTKVRVQESFYVNTFSPSPRLSANGDSPPHSARSGATDEGHEFDRAVKVSQSSPQSAKSPNNIQKVKRSKETVDALRAFVNQPAPKNQLQRCILKRKRNFFASPAYYLYLEKDGQYLMCTRKRVKSKTSNYLISLDTSPAERENPFNIGKIRGDWEGRKYTLYDEGLSPEDTVVPSSLRKELGLIRYASAKSEQRGALYDVIIPRVSSAGVPTTIRPSSSSESISARVEAEDFSDFEVLRKRRPIWDDVVGQHVLRFVDRQSQPSVKNFQLVRPENDSLVLQFGRSERDTFTLDFRQPLTTLQAFFIVITTLDPKTID